MKIEGYWYSTQTPNFPKPIANEHKWLGLKQFVRKIELLQEHAHEKFYTGTSPCRICKKSNGSTEYELGGWRWPSGYLHYIVEHNVKPTPGFKDFVDEKFKELTK